MVRITKCQDDELLLAINLGIRNNSIHVKTELRDGLLPDCARVEAELSALAPSTT